MATRNPLRFGCSIIHIGKMEKMAAEHPLNDSHNLRIRWRKEKKKISEKRSAARNPLVVLCHMSCTRERTEKRRGEKKSSVQLPRTPLTIAVE